MSQLYFFNNYYFSIIEKQDTIYAFFIASDTAINTDYIRRGNRMNKWVYIVLGTSKAQIDNFKKLGADGFYVDEIFR